MEMICTFFEWINHSLELFLESTVPLIASIAEVIGLVIIVITLAKATYHYIRVTLFHDKHDFHHEMSSGLTTALEFLMSAEIAKTFLLPSLQSVIPLAATFALRAMMSLLLHAEMRTAHAEAAEAERREERAARRAKRKAVQELLAAELAEAQEAQDDED
ncbi:MAG: DUF1622 domain-containing protein [Faecalibacterium sp.]